MKAKLLDPELQACLSNAGDQPIEVVFFLKTPKGGPLDPRQTRELAQELIGRAESKRSTKVDAVSIFDNIQSFALRAPASVIKELVNAREIDSARLNRTSRDLLIRPVSKKRVTLRKR
jgi:hypothetical protein